MRIDLSRFRSRFDATGEQEVTLHGYRLERITAREASLTIYAASAASTGEVVQIRAFPSPEETRPRRQVVSAAKKRAAIRHPNVLRAHEAFEEGGHLYLVTEFSDAPTLASRLEQGPLGPKLALRVLSQAAEGVEAFHAAGVTDSFLSPAGILLDPSVGAILTDLGSATSLNQLVQPWAHPHAHYFSPELGQGEHLGARTSVYSLGCILFETLTGSPPYEGNWLDLSDLHSAEPIPAVSERRPELGTAIDSVIARALDEDPGERFSSPGELMRAAAAALKDAKEPDPESHVGTVPMSSDAPSAESELERDGAEADSNAAALRDAETRAQREAEAAAGREPEEAEREAEAAAQRGAEAEAAAQREAEAEARREAEEAKREAEAAAQREAEAAAQREAEAAAQREAEAAAERELEAQREAEAEARRAAEAAAQREVEATAQREAEAAAQREAEAAAAREAEAAAHREAEAEAAREADAAAHRELEAQREAEAATQRELEAQAKREAQAAAQREADAKAQRETEAAAAHEAKAEPKREAQPKDQRRADKMGRKAKKAARREAEAAARREAKAAAQRELEAQREAEAAAQREAEAAAAREAEAKAERGAQTKVHRRVESRTSRKAKKAARREAKASAAAAAERTAAADARQRAEAKARRQAEAAAEREAQAEAQREAQAAAEREARAEARRAAQREAEAAAEREAQAKAKREAQAAAERVAQAEAQREAQAAAEREARAEARRAAQREAEAAAEREAQAKSRREAEAAAELEARAKAKREAQARAEAEAQDKAEAKARAERQTAAAAQRTSGAGAARDATAVREAEAADKPTTATPAPVASRNGTKPKQPSRRVRTVVLGCGLIGALAVGGYLAGDAETPGPSPANLATAGPLSVALPSAWERRTAASSIPELRLGGAIAAGPRGSEQAGMVAGRTGGSGLLPAELVQTGAAAPEPVRLGIFEAYRRGIKAAGAPREIVTYSVPTSDGAVIIACHTAAGASRTFMRECERVASTLRLKGLRAISLSVLVAEDRRLADILSRLRDRRSAHRRLLSRARTPDGQAFRANRLQVAYRDARRSVEELAARRESSNRQELVRAMRQVERSYGVLARATVRPSRADFNAARRAVLRAERALAPLLARPAA